MQETPKKSDLARDLEDIDVDLEWVECVHGEGIRKRVEELLAMPENISIKIHRAAQIAVHEYWQVHGHEIRTMLDVEMGAA